MKFEKKDTNLLSLISPLKSTTKTFLTERGEYLTIDNTPNKRDSNVLSNKSPIIQQKRILSKNILLKSNDLQQLHPKNEKNVTLESQYEKKKVKENHKKTMSVLNLNMNYKRKILDFKVDDENYKKLLNLDPLKKLMKGCGIENKINHGSKEKNLNTKKHYKRDSCNNDDFFKNKIATADKAESNTRNSCLNKERENIVDYKSKVKRKTEGQRKKMTFEADLREEREEDEETITCNNERLATPPLTVHNEEQIPLNTFDTIIKEIFKNNNEMKELMNFSYNKVNTSNITEENSMLLSINSDLYASNKNKEHDNYVKFENNEDYIKRLLFKN